MITITVTCVCVCVLQASIGRVWSLTVDQWVCPICLLREETVRKRMLSMRWPHSLWESFPTRGTEHKHTHANTPSHATKTKDKKYTLLRTALHLRLFFYPVLQPPWRANGRQWLHVEKSDQSPHRTHLQDLGPTCSLRSPALSHDHEGDVFFLLMPLSPTHLPYSHTRTSTNTQCWTSTDLPYEHLNAGYHAAEASSTTCNWETSPKSNTRWFLIDFSCLLTDIGFFLCVCMSRGPDPQLCDHKP